MTTLQKPKRRKRIFWTKEDPLPIPIASLTGIPASKGQWYYHTGELQGDSVVVKCSRDINNLYRMGFFGKGQFSKSDPQGVSEMNSSRKRVRDIPKLKVISKRRYCLHKKWSSQAETGVVESEEDTSQFQHSLKQNIEFHENLEEYDDRKNSEKAEQITRKFWKHSDKEELIDCSGPGTSDDIKSVMKVTSDQNDKDNWISSKKDDNTKTAADFWISETNQDLHFTVENNETKEDTSWSDTDEQAAAEFWGADTNENLNCTVKNDEKEHDVPWSITNVEDEAQKLGKSKKDIASSKSESDESCISNTEIKTGYVKSVDYSLDNVVIKPEDNFGNCINENDVILDNKTDTLEDNLLQNKCKKEESDNIISEEEFDPESLIEEEDGHLLVVDDTDDSEDEVKICKLKWKPVQKREPFPVQEYLQLSLEEAFFLAFGLGCLKVLDETKKPLNLTEMWRRFSSIHQRFMPNYIVYHHFRSKGWVPKSGLKYGADFLLYKQGPPFYHSSYSVIVRMVDEDLHDIQHCGNRNISWISLAGINRITEHVNKELMMCYVIKPGNLSHEDLKSPKCLPEFKVQEIVVKRFVSKQERDKDGNIIPETVP